MRKIWIIVGIILALLSIYFYISRKKSLDDAKEKKPQNPIEDNLQTETSDLIPTSPVKTVSVDGQTGFMLDNGVFVPVERTWENDGSSSVEVVQNNDFEIN